MSTPTPQSPPPKPVSEVWRPQLVRLPALTLARRCFRHLLRFILKLAFHLFLKPEIRGLENLPSRGPALLVTNHLGDADAALLVSVLPAGLDAIGKIEMYDFPIIGRLMHWYGTIWVHRGRPDRRSLHSALQGLREGRMILIAPEGRYSLIHGLEEGTSGAAFLARKSGAPVVPLAMTGTENTNVYGHLRRLHRAPVTLSVGVPFHLGSVAGDAGRGSPSLRSDTERIMKSLAHLLPPEYQGVYLRK